MKWIMLGQRANLYGVIQSGNDIDYVKLNKAVWAVSCDPDDGYRSYCESIKRVENADGIGPFFDTPLATVTIREWEAEEGFELVDDKGHVWLTIGTDNSDDYYPSYTFWWQPKKQ